jgi:hypothetical protein
MTMVAATMLLARASGAVAHEELLIDRSGPLR